MIFVAKSWASRMLARRWVLGVPPDEVEQAYRQMGYGRYTPLTPPPEVVPRFVPIGPMEHLP